MGNSELSAGIAVALAISIMIRLRCLHPPSGAVALTAILGGPAITGLGYSFVLFPVGVNTIAITFMALIFNNTIRRHYPHRVIKHSHPHHTSDPLPSERLRFTRTDLDEALKAHGELLDISPDDLEEILMDAEFRADRRRFGAIACSRIMSMDVVSVSQKASLEEAWKLLAHHKVKALPVVNELRELVGIVSLHDFYVPHTATGDRLPSRTQADTVEEIMTTPVHSAQPDQPILDLIEKFSDGGLHHMPVVDRNKHVVGMLTQSDLIAALFRLQNVPSDEFALTPLRRA